VLTCGRRSSLLKLALLSSSRRVSDFTSRSELRSRSNTSLNGRRSRRNWRRCELQPQQRRPSHHDRRRTNWRRSTLRTTTNSRKSKLRIVSSSTRCAQMQTRISRSFKASWPVSSLNSNSTKTRPRSRRRNSKREEQTKWFIVRGEFCVSTLFCFLLQFFNYRYFLTFLRYPFLFVSAHARSVHSILVFIIGCKGFYDSYRRE
jgi:hypothetical protein